MSREVSILSSAQCRSSRGQQTKKDKLSFRSILTLRKPLVGRGPCLGNRLHTQRMDVEFPAAL